MNIAKMLVPAAAVAAMMLLGSCSGGDTKGKPLSDYKNISQSDSLSYLYGEMFANQFWQVNAGDSASTTAEARKQYLEGVAKGLKLGEESKAYSEGVLAGLQMALGSVELEKELGVKLNPDMLRAGLAHGLSADSALDITASQMAMQNILQTLGEKKDKENNAKAEKAVKAAASKAGMKLIAPQMYGKVLKAGTGPLLKDGDAVNINLTITDAAGKDVGGQMPTMIHVGTEFANLPLGEVIKKMHAEESMSLLTSAVAIFGPNCSRLNMNPDDVLSVKISTLGLADEAAASPAAGAPTPQPVQ